MSQNSSISYRQEWLRKLIHFSSLWMPLCYALTDRQTTGVAIGVVMAIVLTVELFWHRLPITGRIYERLFGRMLRTHEKQGRKLSGASYTLIAGFVCIWCFDEPIAMAALLILVIADALAALIGRRFGNIPLAGKSLQGTAAFFACALVITGAVAHTYAQPPTFLWVGLLASLAATLAELYSKRFSLDDNLTIPISYGIVLAAIL